MRTSTGLYTSSRRPPHVVMQTMEERREYGRRGGSKVVARYGVAHLAALAKKGGEAIKAKLGRDHFAAMAKKRWKRG